LFPIPDSKFFFEEPRPGSSFEEVLFNKPARRFYDEPCGETFWLMFFIVFIALGYDPNIANGLPLLDCFGDFSFSKMGLKST
jgi:hypothetical protein